MERIAEGTGIGSAADLRSHFAQAVGMSPSAYRSARRRIAA